MEEPSQRRGGDQVETSEIVMGRGEAERFVGVNAEMGNSRARRNTVRQINMRIGKLEVSSYLLKLRTKVYELYNVTADGRGGVGGWIGRTELRDGETESVRKTKNRERDREGSVGRSLALVERVGQVGRWILRGGGGGVAAGCNVQLGDEVVCKRDVERLLVCSWMKTDMGRALMYEFMRRLTRVTEMVRYEIGVGFEESKESGESRRRDREATFSPAKG